jgi:hypothetical protein
MSQQSDNVLSVQSKNVRFLKNELRFSFKNTLKESLDARGHYYDEHRRD